MKKWFHISVGVVLGVLLSLSVTVAAEQLSRVGKRVEAEVPIVLDGQALDIPAIIIEGTSFAPVRVVGEMVGREVDWQEGKVIMNTVKRDRDPSIIDWPRPDLPLEEWPRINVEGKINELTVFISNLEVAMLSQPATFDTPENRTKLADLKAELEIYEQRLAEILEQEAAE